MKKRSLNNEQYSFRLPADLKDQAIRLSLDIARICREALMRAVKVADITKK